MFMVSQKEYCIEDTFASSLITKKVIMGDRVQLHHLLIDIDFFDKPTVRALIYKHGQLSGLLYVRWLMLMSRASNALVTRDSLFSVGQEVLSDADKCDSVLSYCLQSGMIQEVEDGVFTNDRVIKDQESCAVKLKGAAQRQKKYRESALRVSNALLTRLPVSAPVTVTEDLNIIKKRCEYFQVEDQPPPESAPDSGKVGTSKLVFDWYDWEGLAINHYHGKRAELLDDVRAATDYLKSTGKTISDPCAYMRSWIRRKSSLKATPTKPTAQQTQADAISELAAKYMQGGGEI